MGQIEKSALDSVPNDEESSRARPVGCDDAHRTHSDGHPLQGAETGPRSTRTTASSRTRSFGGRAELQQARHRGLGALTPTGHGTPDRTLAGAAPAQADL